MTEYVDVRLRAGATKWHFRMVSGTAAERGGAVELVGRIDWLPGGANDVATDAPVACRRFDEIVVDYNGDAPFRCDREWLEAELASRLSGPDARMTVFHT